MNNFFYTQSLCKHFGGIKAVNNVDLKLNPCELHSLIGPNGAGKTTLVNLITGLIPPSSGKIVFNGQDITHKSACFLVQEGLCRTFQITSIFPDLTVFENVRIARQLRVGGSLRMFSRKDSLQQVQEDTRDILKRIGLDLQSEALAMNLAHGDQRVLEVGISLCSDPKLLILDEPTAGMSPAETRRTTELVKQLSSEISVVLIEHDMDVVMGISDYITVLDQGTIIAQGTPSEIKQNEDVKEAYLGTE